jgi:hypothetical protein
LSGKKKEKFEIDKKWIRKYWNEWERERWLTSIVTSSTFQGKKKKLNINCITILAIYRASQYQH